MEQEQQGKGGFASENLTFDSWSGHVYYLLDYRKESLNMYLGSRRKGEAMDIDSKQKFGLAECSYRCGYYNLNDIETGEFVETIRSGLPKLDDAVYKASPFVSRWKCNFYCRKYEKNGITISDLYKFENAYRDCLTTYYNKEHKKRQESEARYQKIRAEQEARQERRTQAVEDLMERK